MTCMMQCPHNIVGDNKFHLQVSLYSDPLITRWSGSMTSKRVVSEARYRFYRGNYRQRACYIDNAVGGAIVNEAKLLNVRAL